MSRRLPTARTSIVALVSTKITRQSPTRNRVPGRPVRRLTLPAPVCKPLDLGLYVGPHVRRKFAKLAAGIMSPCDRLHAHNISSRDDPARKISQPAISILSRPFRELYFLPPRPSWPSRSASFRRTICGARHQLRARAQNRMPHHSARRTKSAHLHRPRRATSEYAIAAKCCRFYVSDYCPSGPTKHTRSVSRPDGVAGAANMRIALRK
jgi:hypothetical protein